MVSLVYTVFSEPHLMRKFLRQQLGNNRSTDNKISLFGQQLNDNCTIHNLLATAVHAILIDSGFVLFDPVTGLQIDRFHLPDESPSYSSFHYSLPQLFNFDQETGPHFTHHFVLKFQTLTHFLQVYGSLGKRDSGIHRLSLDEQLFVSNLDSLWTHCLRYHSSTVTSSVNSNSKREVLKFLKIVKDGLAYPLLIDLCYSSGLTLPSCMMNLPLELKRKVLDSLPGVDIARMACVSSDMRSLASNNDLWMRKVDDEFGDRVDGMRGSNWKKLFSLCWKNREDWNSRRKLKQTMTEDLRLVRNRGPVIVTNVVRWMPPLGPGVFVRGRLNI